MEPLDFLMSFRSSQVGVIANGAGGCWCSLPATLVPPGGVERFESCQQKRAFVTHRGPVPDISKERSYEAFCMPLVAGTLATAAVADIYVWESFTDASGGVNAPTGGNGTGSPSLVVVAGSPIVAGLATL